MAHENDVDHREITIETLSSPPIKIIPAPLSKRAAAALVDSIIVGGFWGLFALLTGSGIMSFSSGPIAWTCVFAFTYYFLSEAVFAATFGKFIFKLRVVGPDAEPCSASASLMRNILRFVDWLPTLYLLGVTSILLSQKRQRIGDRVAKTFVSEAQARDATPPPAPFLYH